MLDSISDMESLDNNQLIVNGADSRSRTASSTTTSSSSAAANRKILHETQDVFIHATSATSRPATNQSRSNSSNNKNGRSGGSSPLPDILPGKICITQRGGRDGDRFIQWFHVADLAADEYEAPSSASAKTSTSSAASAATPEKRWSECSAEAPAATSATTSSPPQPPVAADPSWDVIETAPVTVPSLPPPIPPRQPSSSSVSTDQPKTAPPASPTIPAREAVPRKSASPPPLPARCSAATPASKSCANFQSAATPTKSSTSSSSSQPDAAVAFTKNSLAVSFSGQKLHGESLSVEEAVNEDDDDDDDDDAAMKKRGIPPNSNAPMARRYERLINFELNELKSFRRSPKGCSWSYLTLILADGTTLPALHFHDGGSSAFVAALQKFVVTRQSASDPRLFLVTSQEAEQKALIKSFDELNLFSDAAPNLMSKLVSDPVTTTLGGFSRVTNFLRDLGSAPKTGSGGVSRRHRDELLSDPFADLPNLMFTSPQDDPEYEIITRVQDDASSPNGPSSSGRGSASSASATPTHSSSPWTSRRPSPGMMEELPPRPTVARGNPIVGKEWAKHLGEDGRVSNVESLKQQIFRGGVDPPLRIEVWKFLLGYYDYASTTKERQDKRGTRVDDYFRMKLQWKSLSPDQESRFSALKERKALIEKDVNRTDRTHVFFQGEKNPNLDVLSDVLMTYVMYNFDLGYVQGMSDLLAPVLVVMENEVDAFWCFVGFMELIGRNFEMDQSTMKHQMIQLHAIIEFVDPELMRYLENHDSGNLYFCFRWLLIHFKREFSFPDIMRLWEVLWTGHPCRNFHLLICVALLDSEKNVLVENEFGFTEILKHINDMSGTIDIDAVLTKAEAIFLQIAGCRSPPRAVAEILGLEAMLCPAPPAIGHSPKIKPRRGGGGGGGGGGGAGNAVSTTPKLRSPSPNGSSTPHSSIEVLTTQSDDDEGMV